MLKPLLCPQCAGVISNFDESMSKGICPFCDCIIVDVQERQKTFKIAGIDTAEDVFRRGEEYLQIDAVDQACRCFSEYADKKPLEFKGWRRLLECRYCGGDFTKLGMRLEKDVSPQVLLLQRMAKTQKSAEERQFLSEMKRRFQETYDDDTREFVAQERARGNSLTEYAASQSAYRQSYEAYTQESKSIAKKRDVMDTTLSVLFWLLCLAMLASFAWSVVDLARGQFVTGLLRTLALLVAALIANYLLVKKNISAEVYKSPKRPESAKTQSQCDADAGFNPAEYKRLGERRAKMMRLLDALDLESLADGAGESGK